MGHSGATGFNSDSTRPGTDALENSWVTGDNPAVDSIYLRLLAHNPAIQDRATNLARDGSKVDDLIRQATAAMALTPKPDLFVIQTIDNDVRCDGTDPDNYASFGDTLSKALTIITSGDPTARIFFVSQWGSVATFMNVSSHFPDVVAANSGDGPCDVFDTTGSLRPERMSTVEDITANYHAQVKNVCAKFAQCKFDNGALQTMTLDEADLTPDHNHLSIDGQAKMAALAWTAMN